MQPTVDPIKKGTQNPYLEEKFANLEQWITSVENKRYPPSTEYDDISKEFYECSQKISHIQAIKLGKANLSLISENTEMITLCTFNIDSLNKRIVDLERIT